MRAAAVRVMADRNVRVLKLHCGRDLASLGPSKVTHRDPTHAFASGT
jgi:hypothetical protein